MACDSGRQKNFYILKTVYKGNILKESLAGLKFSWDPTNWNS